MFFLVFRQEGWRLENENPADADSPLMFKGVVFNEMKGAFVSQQAVTENSYAACQGLIFSILVQAQVSRGSLFWMCRFRGARCQWIIATMQLRQAHLFTFLSECITQQVVCVCVCVFSFGSGYEKMVLFVSAVGHWDMFWQNCWSMFLVDSLSGRARMWSRK